LSVALGLWAGGVYGRGLADPAAVPDMGLMFLWLWLGSEVLVALFVRFGLPLTLNAHRPISRGDAPPLLAPGPGGSPALSDLVMIRSDGRQVILTTRRDSARAAGPLRKWVATLPEGSGTLIHRSLWVATPAVLGHHRRGRRLVIDLAGGHRVEVALSRQSAILCWLRGLAASRAPAASLRTDRPALRPLAHRFPDAARP
ncbi:MAG: hypothetical protein RIT14_1001, partial [Pseudomonadota bacterium]